MWRRRRRRRTTRRARRRGQRGGAATPKKSASVAPSWSSAKGGFSASNAVFDALKAPIEAAKKAVVDFQSVCQGLAHPPLFLYPGTDINCHLSPSMEATVPGAKGAVAATADNPGTVV